MSREAIAVRPGERLVEIDGVFVAHRGVPPFEAVPVSDRPGCAWYVRGRDRTNWLRFPEHPGAVLTDEESALAIAEALNTASG